MSFFRLAVVFCILCCPFVFVSAYYTVNVVGGPFNATNSWMNLNPTDVFLDKSTGLIYAACDDDGASTGNGEGIVQIDVTRNSYTTIVTPQQCPMATSVHVDSARRLVYASCDNGLIKVNLTDGTITQIATYLECPGPAYLEGDTVSGTVYSTCSYNFSNVTNNDFGKVIRISESATDGITITTLLNDANVCSNPGHLQLDKKTGVLYVACYGDGVISINDTVVTTIATEYDCKWPHSVVVDSTHGILYAGCQQGIISFPVAGGAVSLAVENQLLPWQCRNGELAIDELTGVIYVGCSGGSGDSAVVSVHDGILTRIASARQCFASFGLFVDQQSGLLYAGCYFGGLLVVKDNSRPSLARSSTARTRKAVGAAHVHNLVAKQRKRSYH